MDLTEAEDIKSKWEEYTELYTKDLHDPDNHDGVRSLTQSQTSWNECEVKWALGSITMNKSRRGDGIPIELFQILKDDAGKCCTQYTDKFGQFSSGPKTGNGVYIPISKKGNAKEC